jgi:hypothetical protein
MKYKKLIEGSSKQLKIEEKIRMLKRIELKKLNPSLRLTKAESALGRRLEKKKNIR